MNLLPRVMFCQLEGHLNLTKSYSGRIEDSWSGVQSGRLARSCQRGEGEPALHRHSNGTSADSCWCLANARPRQHRSGVLRGCKKLISASCDLPVDTGLQHKVIGAASLQPVRGADTDAVVRATTQSEIAFRRDRRSRSTPRGFESRWIRASTKVEAMNLKHVSHGFNSPDCVACREIGHFDDADVGWVFAEKLGVNSDSTKSVLLDNHQRVCDAAGPQQQDGDDRQNGSSRHVSGAVYLHQRKFEYGCMVEDRSP